MEFTDPVIMKCLAQIKPDYRICLVMKTLEDHPYERIAELLNINIGTVKSRINRAKKQLKNVYIKEVGQHVRQ
ncbi:RNA polymerase sigma factor [bacterium]|nr:RNA polymerase sigma factor [bacterium]